MQRSVLSHRDDSRAFRSAVALCGASLVLGAMGCASDQVELGEAPVPVPAEQVEPACVVEHDVETYNQADIDALAGCTEIHGKLFLHSFEGMDLSPLASLRDVRGFLSVGISEDSPLVQSLHGLEGLEHAGGLTLFNLGVSDLSGLRGLRSVRVLDRELKRYGSTGGIGIYASPGLVNLHGLEQLEDWDQLGITRAEQLVSLDGLPPPLGTGRVELFDAPALRDVSALGAARSLSWLSLYSTGLQNLDGLNLERLEALVLADNPELVQVDALDAVIWLGQLFVMNNDALQRLPALPKLQHMNTLQVTGNDLLQRIPAYRSPLPAADSMGGDFFISGPSNDLKIVTRGFQSVVVGDNASLRAASLPDGFGTGDYVAVYDNPRLTELDLSALIDAKLVSIRGNPQLAEVDVSALSIATRLEVMDNPLLPLATFDGVAAAVREMSQTSAP